jgi:putative PIG3 family NAD(P)H quinone oxidoreductase
MSDALPETMTVIEIREYGGPEVLKLARRELPAPQPNEVLIQVAFAGVNRPDCAQRAGKYKPPPGASELPGLEIAGTVVDRGSDIDQWRRGDQVCALTHGGGYAEYCVAPATQCLPIPAGFDLPNAAALPENYFTVWTNVFDRGRLQAGETLLLHGGASGIGTTAIQLAHRRGANVIATAGSAEKTQVCQSLGADRVVNYREEDFVDAVKEFTDGKGADVILDMVGGDYIPRNLKSLAIDGRLVLIAFLRGSQAEINFAPLMVRRQTITGSTLRPQSIEQKAAIANSLREHVWPLLEQGKMKPILDTTFPLIEAAKAHEMMEANKNIGKIMLQVA